MSSAAGMTFSEKDVRRGASRDQLVVHAAWVEGALHVWAESEARLSGVGHSPSAVVNASELCDHPFAAETEDILAALGPVLRVVGASDGAAEGARIELRLPCVRGVPAPSAHLSHIQGHAAADSMLEEAVLGLFRVPAVRLGLERVGEVLEALEDLSTGSGEALGIDDEGASGQTESAPNVQRDGEHLSAVGESVSFFAAAARFVRHLLAQQRFVPLLMQQADGRLRGVWQVWLADEANSERVGRLLAAMPPSARAGADGLGHDGWAVLEAFLLATGDAMCRRTLAEQSMSEAIEGRRASDDLHVAWLMGLLSRDESAENGGASVAALACPGGAIELESRGRGELVKGVRRWIGGLEDRGALSQWRLLLTLGEPLDTDLLPELESPRESVRWPLAFALQSTLDPRIRAAAEDIWLLPTGAASVGGQRLESPQEVLLAELSRAARVYKPLEGALERTDPSELELTTAEAYRFFREFRPLLMEQGVGVEAPEWWDSPTIRLGARLQIQSEDVEPGLLGGGQPTPTQTRMGLASLVNYKWQIAVGEATLTLEQFERLARQHSPLVRLNGKWVEIRPEDVKAAVKFIGENSGGRMELGRALRLAYASDSRETGVPVLGMEATGWVGRLFGAAGASGVGGEKGEGRKLSMIESPRGFVGTLRPYQLKGLSWLSFLDQLGLGACLADDMGLGKTIQLLALLAHEKEVREEGGVAESAGTNPTLLVVPMSVVANWDRESRRFTPGLRVLVHHGAERLMGEALVSAATKADMVVTTYALAHRDREVLARVSWGRVVLDEAQNIKNPAAKQTRAVHSIQSPRRVALTGTPVENRLSELWSVMDFLNPGYLGSPGEFRRRFALPVERYHDRHRATQLRGLVQPFVLRRLKSDPGVISDLPEKLESKEYCFLTPEQAGLYQTCVGDMLSAADKAEGIQRRGLVLAGLIKLKQICNHPAQFLREGARGEEEPGEGVVGTVEPAAPSRSGKCLRLVEMLDEVIAAGDKALIFTQFRQMGELLAAMLRRRFDSEVLFLHGGTPAAQREQMISAFQEGEASQGDPPSAARSPGAARRGPPLFILSLKAGGVGLNLTAANHVFHFDRWWNPAVEAQATDRAHRIGQTRTVQVHKFVVSGTLEERIDQMIEQKTELASEIIASGEQWLTELSTTQLRDLLTLRPEAIGEADDE